MKFHTDLIDSYMPFFGQAYSGVGYNNDTGMSFTGKPDKYNVEKKGDSYEIEVQVKGQNDVFRIYGNVGIDGNASLSISSNNRSTISYQGAISAPNNLR
jgi:hypothetical protein